MGSRTKTTTEKGGHMTEKYKLVSRSTDKWGYLTEKYKLISRPKITREKMWISKGGIFISYSHSAYNL